MKMSRREFVKKSAWVAPLMAFRGVSGVAWAALPQPQLITTLPFTINAPGHYRLSDNLSINLQKGAAIGIRSSDVLLDLNGRTIANQAGAENIAVGVASLVSGSNISVINGTLLGFHTGLFFGRYAYVERATVRQVNCLACLAMGIVVSGNAAQIEECRVQLPGAAGVVGTLGIVALTTRSSVISNNLVYGSTFANSGQTTGIYLGFAGGGAYVVDNKLSDLDAGIVFGPQAYYPGKHRGNTFTRVQLPVSGGIDASCNPEL